MAGPEIVVKPGETLSQLPAPGVVAVGTGEIWVQPQEVPPGAAQLTLEVRPRNSQNAVFVPVTLLPLSRRTAAAPRLFVAQHRLRFAMGRPSGRRCCKRKNHRNHHTRHAVTLTQIRKAQWHQEFSWCHCALVAKKKNKHGKSGTRYLGTALRNLFNQRKTILPFCRGAVPYKRASRFDKASHVATKPFYRQPVATWLALSSKTAWA